MPIDYISSYKTIYVHFKSNQENEATGFKFTASVISGLFERNNSTNKMKRNEKKQTIFFFFTDCNRNYTRPQGRLISKTIADCEAYIQVPSNYMISLYFTSLDFKLATPCTDDNKPLKVNRFF